LGERLAAGRKRYGRFALDRRKSRPAYTPEDERLLASTNKAVVSALPEAGKGDRGFGRHDTAAATAVALLPREASGMDYGRVGARCATIDCHLD